MTEVATVPHHQVIATKRYEAGPPKDLAVVEPGDTFATTKEEEWISKKKTEVTNTKQIETRVKRQVVLEDGKIVEDSGPLVTTNTTEDTETQEHHQTELRKLGDNDTEDKHALEDAAEDKSKWIATPNTDGIVREVKEKRVLSREETEEIKETEDIQHLGDITDEDFLAAVHSGKEDVREILRNRVSGREIVSTGPRVIKETSKSKKVTDTEDTREFSAVREDGKIITESQRTTQHEEEVDEELPEEAEEKNFHKESFERYAKTRDQEEVDYTANGNHVGHEMRYKTETMEVEKRGEGLDEVDFESLSARARRRNTRQPQKFKEYAGSPLDRKDALTGRPLDFDREEQTRKVETSKWLEHHFGSDSKSSTNSTIDEEESPPKTSYFNVTIKSQPKAESTPIRTYVAPSAGRRMESSYYKGTTEWSERRQEKEERYKEGSPLYPYSHERESPIARTSPEYVSNRSTLREIHNESRLSNRQDIPRKYVDYDTENEVRGSRRLYRDRKEYYSSQDIRSSTRDEHRERRFRRQSPEMYSQRSLPRRQPYGEEKFRRSSPELERPLEEPPPDYIRPSPTLTAEERKATQKTRFANDAPKKSGNIIGQSIRKLVGKIRSASAERKAKQRAKRSPSPSYQQGHIIDSNIGHSNGENERPIQRYYLGEDPYVGSIYGRENKYDSVKQSKISRKPRNGEPRSQSTLGRFSKSTSRLTNADSEVLQNSQTLPRTSSKYEPPVRLNDTRTNTINVSIINTVKPNQSGREPPAKPARTYKSNLLRSKSFNTNIDDMYKSSSPINKLEDSSSGLKSPGLISSLNKNHRDTNDDYYSRNFENHKTIYQTSRSPVRTHHVDIYEPPTRLRDTQIASVPGHSSVIRRGSTSSDFSETYHTTTRSDDPLRPSITNTTKTISKKTIPSRDGRSMETIQSSETKSITKSHYRGRDSPDIRYSSSAGRPVVIEVKNTYSRR